MWNQGNKNNIDDSKKASKFEVTPKFRTNLGVIFMAKLSKQDKLKSIIFGMIIKLVLLN